MSLKLHRTDEVPPGGFWYVQRETSAKLSAASFDELANKVKIHRKSNNIPIGTNFNEEIENQICERMPAGVCTRDHQPSTGKNRITLEAIVRGTATMADWFAHGREKVSREIASKRAAVCSSCHFNQPVSDCPSCSMSKIHAVVNAVVGNVSFDGEGHVHGCQLCSCSIRAMVWMPLDILQRNTPDDLNSQLPEWCWHKSFIIST